MLTALSSKYLFLIWSYSKLDMLPADRMLRLFLPLQSLHSESDIL